MLYKRNCDAALGATGGGRAWPRRAAWLAMALVMMLALACAPPPPPEPPAKKREYGVGPALWRTVQQCNPEQVEELLEAGAKPDYRFGPYLSTPLMQALGSFDNKCPKRIAQILVAAGAGVNSRDLRGWTPLHYLADGHCIPSHLEAMTYLLQHGADPTIEDKIEVTALDLATVNNCELAKGVLADELKRLRSLRIQAERPPWLPPEPVTMEGKGEGLGKGQAQAQDTVNLPWMKPKAEGAKP